MNYKIIVFVLFSMIFASCKTTDKIAYFQDIDKYIGNEEAALINNFDIKICPDDQLSIFVSGIDPNAVAVFNLPLTSFLASGESNVSSTPTVQTYLVDNNGYINFPVIGRIKVAGMTRTDLTALLEQEISKYAKDPMVTVRILNFKISVLGEVGKSGTIEVPNERISILDAISLAGDLTIYGERKNVLLIRDNNGKKEFHRFDLTSSDLFTSPYFYLQQNDIVYVEPNKNRKNNSKYSQSAQFNTSVASTVISAVSVIASLIIALVIR